MNAPAYRAEVDGLRALAVVAVVLFHAGVPGLSGGFIGVDIFFVISGFLITLILMRDIEAGEFSLLRFYERRVRRILPALFLVVIATAPIAWVVMLPSQREAMAESLAALAIFISNLLFGAQQGYFSPDAAELPFLHTWSLSVEEQFYVFFPLLLAFLWRFGGRVTAAVLAALLLASLALAQYGSWRDPSLNFYFTGSRIWELMAGALTALAERRFGKRVAEIPALVGLAALALPLFLYGETTPNPSVWTAIPVAGTALFLFYGRGGSLVGRMFSLRPVVTVGLISYSAYLWHHPLFAIARLATGAEPSPLAMAALIVATFGLAVLSWRYVEMPFRRPPLLLPRRPALFGSALSGLALMLAVGVAGWAVKGDEAGWLAANPDKAPTYLLLAEARKAASRAPEFGPCRFNTAQFGAEALARIEGCVEKHGPALVILGDSHGIDVYAGLASLASDDRFVLGVTNVGCRLDSGKANCPLQGFTAVAKAHPDWFAQVLFVQAGSPLLTGPHGEPGSRQLFRRLSWDEPVPDYPPDSAEIARITAYLDEIAASLPVTWIAPRIEPQVSPAKVLADSCAATFALRPNLVETFERLDATIAEALVGTGVSYIPLSRFPLDMARDFLDCQTDYWSDGDHWSPAGEAYFGARLLQVMPGLLAPQA
jgi:peptidoglycan/LPS O-acetylase OafA/YrhL